MEVGRIDDVAERDGRHVVDVNDSPGFTSLGVEKTEAGGRIMLARSLISGRNEVGTWRAGNRSQ